MASKIKLRRGTAQAWIDAAPVILDSGEPGYDSTNNKLKLGDGITEWQSLPYLTDATVSLGDFTFTDSTMNIPVIGGGSESFLNAGGVETPNSVQLRTSVNYINTDINTSEIALEAGNGGISAQVYGHWTGGADGAGGPTLVYAGVENVSGGNGPGFAGMVAIDPNVTSQYAVVLDGSNNITIGATGGSGVTTEYTAAVGVLNKNTLNMTGLAITPDKLVLNNSDNAWVFDSFGSLSLAGDLNVGYNDGHIYIDQSLSGATSIRWVNSDVDTTMLRVYLDNKETLQNEQLEVGYNAEDGFYIVTTSNTNGIYNNPGDDHSWFFDKTGNIRLPEGGDIVNSNGISVLNGVSSQLLNGSAVLALNANGSLTFPNESIQSTAYELASGELTDQELSIDVVLDRTSQSPYWYNLFGDTGATITANVAVNGSVCHDSGGNVYVLGSTQHANSLASDNLFLKYSPEGRLLWRKTWTDNNGEPCGSYNASMRYVAANVALGTQDTIVWAAQVPWTYVSYIGTMDTDGNLVDQYGSPRLPTRLDNFAVTDLEWSGVVPSLSDSMVTVVGQHYLSGPGYHFPTVAGVDLANAAVIGDTTVMPDGTDLNVGMLSGTPWANMYKAIAVVPNSTAAAAVGSYYDGSWSHAMVSISDNGPPVTYSIGAEFTDNHVIGEDLCCDVNGNVYVIVNNITNGYAVLVKSTPGDMAEGIYAWQLLLGPNGLSSNTFYASSVVYDNGFVYVLGQYYDADTSDTDAMLIKVDISNGDIVWSRRIGSPGDDGISAYGPPGWESSSGISVYDGVVAISFATEDKTPGLGGGPEANTVTLQYPMDGDLLSLYGDFLITDFDPGHTSAGYEIVTLNTALGEDNITSAFAALQATTLTVGTGWTNTQWDMEQNRQVYDLQTWKFNYDGSFDTSEITHLEEVKITARVAPTFFEPTPTPSTWIFQNNNGLQFPDGSVQYGAYIESEMSMDGGSAVTVFNILPRPPVADGGGSSSRFGINDPVYDGSSGNDYVLDGGGA